jgi:hypothetical protein
MSPELTTAEFAAAARERSAAENVERTVAMYSDEQLRDLRVRWDQTQAAFVDEPQSAVERADALVADAMSKLAEGFARTRAESEEQWKRGDKVSTEDLRQALMRYRSFFTRLLDI